MKRIQRLICRLFGHDWKDTVYALDCNSGCTDMRRQCQMCGGETFHPTFRRWYCQTHRGGQL